MKRFLEFNKSLKHSLLPPGGADGGEQFPKVKSRYAFSQYVPEISKVLNVQTIVNIKDKSEYQFIYGEGKKQSIWDSNPFIVHVKNSQKQIISYAQFFKSRSGFCFGYMPRTRHDYLNKGLATQAYAFAINSGMTLISADSQAKETRHIYKNLVQMVPYCWLYDSNKKNIIKRLKTPEEVVAVYNNPKYNDDYYINLLYSKDDISNDFKKL